MSAEGEERGVVYISRVPPFMRVDEVRTLLSAVGEVTRVYLALEDKAVFKKRRKFKGNSKRNYTEGWVEFASKSQAKLAVQALNSQPIGGKKRYQFHDDLWNLKYLKGFKWTDLSDRIAQEKIVREQRIRNEMSQAKKEQKFFVSKLSQAQQIAKIEERKRKKAGDNSKEEVRVIRHFKQRPVFNQDSAPTASSSSDVNAS